MSRNDVFLSVRRGGWGELCREHGVGEQNCRWQGKGSRQEFDRREEMPEVTALETKDGE